MVYNSVQHSTELYTQGVHSPAQSAAILHSASFLDWNFYQVSVKTVSNIVTSNLYQINDLRVSLS